MLRVLAVLAVPAKTPNSGCLETLREGKRCEQSKQSKGQQAKPSKHGNVSKAKESKGKQAKQSKVHKASKGKQSEPRQAKQANAGKANKPSKSKQKPKES